ncbi:hypothetical protein CGRA01v4_07929 [Colletotrichum graminicola]|uniref:Uncharacterized protein n=1 Tax=Colletotrichum graminicola (strain M1.001 / M2 / FGSC 10212) TaxID=645133 RepID=E3Q7S1_COLGM|nr:uncharacterized protein GLRG_02104 [Colletotrichum graminicola M1.001]EFQ26933.1 hypothetical protein GLRG_02104 [Colletotrichum graminicola M1.001]WDK16646.1 hypothetical protein CGRA01v4_07929 [Colletotrichum graminicola]
MYQTAPSRHHLQLAAPPPYPGIKESRNATSHQSLFADSDNGSDWNDSEPEQTTHRDDRASTGDRVKVTTRQRMPLPRRKPVVVEPDTDQGSWDDGQYQGRSGGQAVPYAHYGLPNNPFPPPAGDPYVQPQPPLGPHPQVQYHPPQSGPLPPGQQGMAYENPFAPSVMPWHGQQAGPYGSNPPAPLYEPHPAWYPAAGYGNVPPNPAHLSTVPPEPYPYPDPVTDYRRGHVPIQDPPNPSPTFEPAPPPRRRRRSPPAAEAPPPEHDLDHLQRRLRAVEIDSQNAEALRQAEKERARVGRQKREMDRLRHDFNASLREAVDDIRREIQMGQSESHSEPGRTPSRMDSGGGRRAGGLAAPERAIYGDRDVWAERGESGGGGGGEQDVLMREIAQFIEGKRRLQPQDHAPGAAFRTGLQTGPGSARGSRMDPELRSEVEMIVYDMLGGSDVGPRRHRRASSRFRGGAASDSFNPRIAAQVDPRNWPQEAYDVGVSPAPVNRLADEREWLGVPRKARRPRPRQEDTGGAGAPQTQGPGSHQQQPPPPQANTSRHQAGASALSPRAWGAGGGGGGGEEEAAPSTRAMVYQNSIANNGARGPGHPGGLARQGGAYVGAAGYENEDAAGFFTDDESDDPEVFRKRDASYPEFRAERVQLPRAPKPPHLRQAGM